MTTHVMTHDRPDGRHATTAVAARNGMAGGLPTGANDIVHSRLLSRSVERLRVKYGRDLDPGLVRRTVQNAYRELEASARLKTFLPVTAAHLAENRLRELAAQARAGRTAADAARQESGEPPVNATKALESTTEAPERAAA